MTINVKINMIESPGQKETEFGRFYLDDNGDFILDVIVGQECDYGHI